jgi:hypothetical protein
MTRLNTGKSLWKRAPIKFVFYPFPVKWSRFVQKISTYITVEMLWSFKSYHSQPLVMSQQSIKLNHLMVDSYEERIREILKKKRKKKEWDNFFFFSFKKIN